MERYLISYTITVGSADPSRLLDGAHTATEELVACLECEGRVSGITVDEDITSVELLDDDE